MNLRKITLFLIISVLFFPKICIRAEDFSKEEEALFVAKKAQEDGFYEVAINLYERFLSNYPNSSKKAEVKLYIGQCYLFQKKYLQALKKFEELLNHPDAQDIKDAVLYWMAEVRFQSNDFFQAANLYRQIIERFPNSRYLASSLYSFGWCLYEMKNYKEAMDYFKMVVSKYPEDKLAESSQLKIMESLYALKDYGGLKQFIEEDLKDSLRIKDTNYIIFYQAEADYYLGNFESAQKIYERLIKESNDPRIISLAKLGLGWCFIKLNNYKDAQEVFSQIDEKSLDRENRQNFLLGKAYVLSQTKRFLEALEIYTELSKTATGSVLIEAYLGKGLCLYNLSRYNEAVGVYQEAFKNLDIDKLESDLVDRFHYNLAWAYLKEARFKEAISEFQKVASGSQDKIIKISSLCLAADTYQDAGDYQKAIQTYEEILKDYPDNLYTDYIQYQLGSCFLKISNYDSAILAFKGLLANYPYSKLLDEATYALALTYFQKEDFQKAKEVLTDFDKNFKTSPLVGEASYLYAVSLYNMERFGEAMEVFKGIVRDHSENRELVQKAEYEIADCLYRLGREQEAVNSFNILRSKYPDSLLSAEILWWLGSYYWRLGNFSLAKRYFETIIQNFPQSSILSDAYYSLGFIYEQENNYNKAIEYFNKTKETAEPDLAGQALIAIADILVKQKDLSGALNLYRQVMDDYPNLSVLVYPKIAEANYHLGNLKEAVDFYRKAVSAASAKQAGIFQFKVAECLQEAGQTPEAIEEYLKIAYLYPEDKSLVAKALIRVAQSYEDKNDIHSAKKLYEKVIELNVQEAKYAKERLDSINLQ